LRGPVRSRKDDSGDDSGPGATDSDEEKDSDEYGGSKYYCHGDLYKMSFLRICLDEGHMIKNAASKSQCY
jgi:SNF2 family DNA or RNA helicase